MPSALMFPTVGAQASLRWFNPGTGQAESTGTTPRLPTCLSPCISRDPAATGQLGSMVRRGGPWPAGRSGLGHWFHCQGLLGTSIHVNGAQRGTLSRTSGFEQNAHSQVASPSWPVVATVAGTQEAQRSDTDVPLRSHVFTDRSSSALSFGREWSHPDSTHLPALEEGMRR